METLLGWEDATDRLTSAGLDPSHQWVYWGDGDCFNGEHAMVMCGRCKAEPFTGTCYFELRRDGTSRPDLFEVDPLALAPCPGDGDE